MNTYGRDSKDEWERSQDRISNLSKNSKTTKNKKQAIEDGDSLYLGRPCVHGHNGIRYIGGNCVSCSLSLVHASKNGVKRSELLASGKAKRSIEDYLEEKRLRDEFKDLEDL